MAEHHHQSPVVIIMRGLPGSGKSHLARRLLAAHPRPEACTIVSTDDYFVDPVTGQYRFDVRHLSAAHDWNYARFAYALQNAQELVIVDNTNVELWEAKQYVELALQYRYHVEFHQPSTQWWLDRDLDTLSRMNSHNISVGKLLMMLGKWQKDCSVELVLQSQRVPKNDAPPREVCRFHVRCICRYGAQCRFSHDISSAESARLHVSKDA